MSKKLIAGAGVVAGLAVALAPLATYAEPIMGQTDTLQLNLAATCNIAVTGGIAHASTVGTWTDDTLAVDVANGNTYTLGTTTFGIKCTGAEDWSMSVAGEALDGEDTEYNIPFANAAANTSYWNLTTSTSDADVTATGLVYADGAIATGAHATATGAPFDDALIVTYSAGISDSQAADTYEGTVVYTLTANAHS